MTFPRFTLARPARLEGFGLHTGLPCTAVLHPGDRGIAFRCGSERIQASPAHVAATSLCTQLGPIGTVEHLMAACAGMGVTDLEVELDIPELPAMDGSALDFARALEEAGLQAAGTRTVTGLFSRIFQHDGEEKLAVSAGDGHWKYRFQSTDRYPFDQVYEVRDLRADFLREIAPARTFGWESDLEKIAELGLAKGLTRESAALLGQDGPLDPLRFPDEPARHKLLDAMGDLYLAGVPVFGLNFAGERSGHRLNVEAARRLAMAVTIEDAP